MQLDFSLMRIILMIRKYFYENIKREIMCWCIITILFILLDHRVFVLFVLFTSGLINLAHLHNEFYQKSTKTGFLMMPASQSEKIFSLFLLNTLYHFIMILIAYSVANLLVTFVYHSFLKLQVTVNWDLFNLNNTIYLNGYIQKVKQNVFFNIFGLFALSQSIVSLGFLYFKNNQLFKTVISILVIILSIAALQVGLFKTLWEVKYISNTLYAIIVMISDSTVPAIIDNAMLVGSYLAFPTLWVISYFTLTEKQV